MEHSSRVQTVAMRLCLHALTRCGPAVAAPYPRRGCRRCRDSPAAPSRRWGCNKLAQPWLAPPVTSRLWPFAGKQGAGSLWKNIVRPGLRNEQWCPFLFQLILPCRLPPNRAARHALEEQGLLEGTRPPDADHRSHRLWSVPEEKREVAGSIVAAAAAAGALPAAAAVCAVAAPAASAAAAPQPLVAAALGAVAAPEGRRPAGQQEQGNPGSRGSRLDSLHWPLSVPPGIAKSLSERFRPDFKRWTAGILQELQAGGPVSLRGQAGLWGWAAASASAAAVAAAASLCLHHCEVLSMPQASLGTPLTSSELAERVMHAIQRPMPDLAIGTTPHG